MWCFACSSQSETNLLFTDAGGKRERSWIEANRIFGTCWLPFSMAPKSHGTHDAEAKGLIFKLWNFGDGWNNEAWNCVLSISGEDLGDLSVIDWSLIGDIVWTTSWFEEDKVHIGNSPLVSDNTLKLKATNHTWRNFQTNPTSPNMDIYKTKRIQTALNPLAWIFHHE